MKPKQFLYIFLLFMILLWIGGIVFIGRFYSTLDEYKLAGVFGIALIFMPLLIAGVWSEVPDNPIWHDAWRLVMKFWVVVAAIFLGFCGGLWVLLVLFALIWPSWLPEWLLFPTYIIAASWYVAGLLKFYWWLSGRINQW